MTTEKQREFAAAVNTLLAHLRGFEAVEVVSAHYILCYSNEAPGLLLAEDLKNTQRLLDEVTR